MNLFLVFLIALTSAVNICPNPSSYSGQVVCDAAGGYCGECVSFYKICARDNRVTNAWIKGAAVRGNDIPVGAGIATFPNGKYLGHAAVYVSQDSTGILVWDQWRGQTVHQRRIRWGGGGANGVNDGDKFFVIEGGSGGSPPVNAGPTPRSPPRAPQSGSGSLSCTVNADNVRVRPQPCTSRPECAQLTTLSSGTSVSATTETQSADGHTWRRVTSPQDGWIASQYLDCQSAPVAVQPPPRTPQPPPRTPSPPPRAPTPPPPKSSGSGSLSCTVNADTVRVRSQPCTSRPECAQLTTLSSGTSVTATTETQNADGYTWRRITSPRNGWMASQFLDCSSNKPAATPRASSVPKTSPRPAPVSVGSNRASASYYEPNGGFGSCGQRLSNSDLIVAMPTQYMKAKCGSCIRVSSGGKSVVVTVRDTCPGCAAKNRIDLGVGAFTRLGTKSQGVIQVTWDWVDCGSARQEETENTDNTEDNGTGLPPAALAFVVIGCALLVFGGLLGAFLFVRRRRNANETV